MKFGWTTCLTYETEKRKLGHDYFSALLNEMKHNGMQQLVIMMDNCHLPPVDPYNHGLAWCVKNPRLKPFIDHDAVNANPGTEFVSKIIDQAHELDIEVLFEIKYHGLRDLKISYPGIDTLCATGASATMSICCDSDAAHQYMRDKTEDILTAYPKVDGITLEHPSFWGVCRCTASVKRNLESLGTGTRANNEDAILDRQAGRISWCVSDLINIAKAIVPDLQFGMTSGYMPTDSEAEEYARFRGHSIAEKYARFRGHTIEALKNIKGLDFVLPYGEGRHRDKETVALEKLIEYLNPLNIYIHTVIRKTSPEGYPLPSVGPAYIENIVAWAKKYSRTNARLLGLTFFNEVRIPDENRTAVYESIQT